MKNHRFLGLPIAKNRFLLLYFTEKINHLKVNHARWRKVKRNTYLKVNRKVRARQLRKTFTQDFHARQWKRKHKRKT